MNKQTLADFKARKIAIHCQNIEEEEKLLTELDKLGFKWRQGQKPLDFRPIARKGYSHCYIECDYGRLCVGYSPNCQRVEFSSLILNDEESWKPF